MPVVAPAAKTEIVEIAPELLDRWREAGEVVIVDVREDFEHAGEHIPGALNIPLSRFDADDIRRRLGSKRVVFHCRGGKRSADAAGRFCTGDHPVFHLAGGITAWKAAGLRTERAASGPKIDVMRQTQIVIGTLVLAGVLLGAFVSPWLLIISGFMGAGLIFAGASGACGMALLLGRMPWNRVSQSCTRGADPRPGDKQ